VEIENYSLLIVLKGVHEQAALVSGNRIKKKNGLKRKNH
jgi:hypothetical protein